MVHLLVNALLYLLHQMQINCILNANTASNISNSCYVFCCNIRIPLFQYRQTLEHLYICQEFCPSITNFLL